MVALEIATHVVFPNDRAGMTILSPVSSVIGRLHRHRIRVRVGHRTQLRSQKEAFPDTLYSAANKLMRYAPQGMGCRFSIDQPRSAGPKAVPPPCVVHKVTSTPPAQLE
jgi:hypothetical protein